jgi:radical SAM superfamily enzyme YgiQ (UPF0313 family)
MNTQVYLADLRYNYSGVLANDCMPLGVAYMKAVMDRDCPEVESRLFAYPDKLLDALKGSPPQVLMLSNYVWNEGLSFQFAKLAKRVNPKMLVVMGGPNISLEPERQLAYLNAHPEIDIYILGEADFLAREIVLQFADTGHSVSRIGERDLPSSVFRRPDGQSFRNPTWPRHKEVEEIPSPWLTGIQDEFFDGKLAPMIETNRGCPFTCTFCCQGTTWYTKVHNFSKERIREEIFYIAARIKERSPRMGTLRIADSNYGMYERDPEISSYIGEVQREYAWPTFIDATTGKNRPERIIKSVEQVGGALVLYQAVQSLDDDVLRNVKRSTIKLEAYEQLQVHMRGRGLRSVSDLILGLPGESLKTHLAALHKLLDSGIESLHNFQAMLLKGSEMETMEARKQFGFDSRFRVLPKNFGVYGDEKVIDVEEIVVGTDTLPFDDYVTARKYHLSSSVFWNDSWFQSPLQFVQIFGVKASEWWEAMMQALEHGSAPVRKFLDDFVVETKGELFPTRESCLDFYSTDENFRRLQQGEVGDNLMYKYRAIASFYLWPEICAAAMDGTKALLVELGLDQQIPDFDHFWADFHHFVELKHAHGSTRNRIFGPVEALLHYDFEAWLASGELSSPQNFRFDQPRRCEFRLREEGRQELDSALTVWTCELKGLTKLVTRIRITSQIRELHYLPEPDLQQESILDASRFAEGAHKDVHLDTTA